MKHCRIAGMILLMAVPFLQGCSAATIAMNAIPAIIGTGAIAGADDRSPFRIPVGQPMSQSEADLAMFDEQIKKAECGDPESQYWLANQLQNNFNQSPNKIEIYKWYRLAESARYGPATEKLLALAATMSEPEITDARQRAQSWQAKTDCQEMGSVLAL